MWRLKTLGTFTLTRQGEADVPVQRLRLALLGLLAHAGDRGLSRDKLIGFLWAETPSESAGHKLEQAIYMLRRQLGEGIFQGPDPLRINSQLLTSDVTEFDRALHRGALEEAASLYAGPFLDGSI